MVHALFQALLIFSLAVPVVNGIIPIHEAQAQSSKSVKKKSTRKGKRKRKSKRKRRRKKSGGQNATVVVDGSPVYEVNNFDAPVMQYLDRGKKVRISKKVYPGIGGLGTFYKVRLRKGVFGYITDVDIQISGRAGVAVTQKKLQAEDPFIGGDPTRIRDDLDDPSVAVPDIGDTVYLTRYVGGGATFLNYTEKIAGSKESASTGFINFKMSGPGKMMGGLPLDLELLLLLEPPSFYDDFASSSSGIMMIAHAFALFPIIDEKRTALYYGFGPILKYSAFSVKLKETPALGDVDSQEISLGAGLSVGFAKALGNRWALRVEGSYSFESESYFGFGGSIQMKY